MSVYPPAAPSATPYLYPTTNSPPLSQICSQTPPWSSDSDGFKERSLPYGAQPYPPPGAPPSPPYYPHQQPGYFYTSSTQPQTWDYTPSMDHPATLHQMAIQAPQTQPLEEFSPQQVMLQPIPPLQFNLDENDVYIVLVRNLEWKVKWQELKDLVRGYCNKIERAEVYTYEDGRSKGYGYVSIRGKEATMMVIDKLDGMEHKGRILSARLGSLSEAGDSVCMRDGSKKGNYADSATFGIIPVPYLPVEYSDAAAMQALLGDNPTPLESAEKHQSIAQQAYLHYNARAANNATRAMNELAFVEKARQTKNWRRIIDGQRAAQLHQEAQVKAEEQARIAYQLAAEHLSNANKLRAATGQPPLAMNVTAPFLSSQAYHQFSMATPHVDVYPSPPMELHASQPIMNLAQTANEVAPAPMYVTQKETGLPVNLSNGAVETEPRGVFIGNLPYQTSWMALKDYLRGAGKILRCDVPQSPEGKPRGYAVALFQTPAEAKQAVEMFNDVAFNGRPLRVRLDRFCETKNPGGRRDQASVCRDGVKSDEKENVMIPEPEKDLSGKE